MKLFWFIPTFGDSRYLASLKGARRTTFGYVRQTAEDLIRFLTDDAISAAQKILV